MTGPQHANAQIWVLLGSRHGDNQQLLALAEALGVPYRPVRLAFNAFAALPPIVLGASKLAWRPVAASQITAPWPRAVLAAGRKTVSSARWIQRQSGGQARLIHLNRPWAPLSWFDLVVTTPQYAVPPRPNVLVNHLPFQPPGTVSEAELPAALQPRAAKMPRPWTTVMLGGDSRPYVLDSVAASALGEMVNRQVAEHGGSAWVLGSPRTPAASIDAMERALNVPSAVVRWGSGANPYAALRGLSDRFVVTSDSASMLVEGLLSGRPVTPFYLEPRPDWRWRLVARWREAAANAPGSFVARGFDAAVDAGLLSSVRDVALFCQALKAAGAFDVPGRALALAERDRQATLTRVRELLQARC